MDDGSNEWQLAFGLAQLNGRWQQRVATRSWACSAEWMMATTSGNSQLGLLNRMDDGSNERQLAVGLTQLNERRQQRVATRIALAQPNRRWQHFPAYVLPRESARPPEDDGALCVQEVARVATRIGHAQFHDDLSDVETDLIYYMVALNAREKCQEWQLALGMCIFTMT